MSTQTRPSVAIPADLEYEILSRLGSAEGPNGSGSLWAELREAGIEKSPATVGRILRLLDLQGHTRCVGFRGRALTEAGARRLAELRAARERSNSHGLLIESVRPTTIGELVDILLARRAIEREIVRLAALRASDQQIEALWAALADQRQAVKERGIAIEEDRHFHEQLAAASGNRVLIGTLRLIRRNVDMQRLLEDIRRGRASGLVVDHQAVLEAVARHDSAAAEAAMLTHLDHIIGDVMAYCRALPDGLSARMVASISGIAPEAAALE